MASIDLGQAPKFDVPDYVNPLSEALRSGLSTAGAIQDLYKNKYANMIAQAKAQYAQPQALAELQKAQAEPGLVNAQANQANSYANWQNIDASRLQKTLPYVAQLQEADINEKKAQANYYNMGGRGGSTGSKDQMMFQQNVGRDNPNLRPEEIEMAANIIAGGGNQMPDGRPLKINPLTRMSLDRAVKSTTTAPLITKGIQANQADAELKAADQYVTPKIQPYGTTYFNKSPQQIIDTFKNDDASQKRLGEFMGAQALQYEAAQIRNRIAQGEPSVYATQELMGKAGQIIDAKYPRLSAKARAQAINTIDEGLEQMLTARNRVGISPSSLTGKVASGMKSNRPRINEDNIQETMKKTGLSRDQVIEKLKAKGWL